MDLTDSMKIESIRGKWLKYKNGCNIGKIMRIKSDHWKEFANAISFAKYCNKHGIAHEFLAPKTPEQNDVVE